MRVTARTLRSGDADHELIWTALAVVCAAGAWLAVVSGVPVPVPACVFKAVTGWPCLTCGATRALRALLGLDLVAAVRSNPLVTAVAAGWTAYAVYGAGALAGAWPRFRVQLESRERTRLSVCAVACALATWTYLVADGR